MKFIIIIYTTNKLTIVQMEDIRGVRLRKFNLRKIILGVRMHFRHTILSDLSNNNFSGYAITSLISYSTLGCIRSGPGDLLILSWLPVINYQPNLRVQRASHVHRFLRTSHKFTGNTAVNVAFT